MLISFKESVFRYISKIKANSGKVLGYKVLFDLSYYSPRYKKFVLVEKGDKSDGATYVKDINSYSWIVHDELCNTGKFEDGTKCTNLQASMILYDILKTEGRWFRKYTWFLGTYLFGGAKARKNGMS